MKIVSPTDRNWLEESVNILKEGGIILHPTDTVYGLAVDATNENAIKKLFELKQRPAKAVIMVVRDLIQAEEYVEINNDARTLAEKFWPGALTLVLPKKKTVPDILSAGLANIGIRIPDHPVTNSLSAAYENPYTSTSANLSGGPTSYKIEDALPQLDINLIDLVINAGPLPEVPPSMVIDLTTDLPRILRQGSISETAIRRALR
jgi:L-threonylcarbamoyladenylate synthase